VVWVGYRGRRTAGPEGWLWNHRGAEVASHRGAEEAREGSRWRGNHWGEARGLEGSHCSFGPKMGFSFGASWHGDGGQDFGGHVFAGYLADPHLGAED
jgi:hypothetical protein